MLYYAAVFFVIALVAALFGFGGIAAGAAGNVIDRAVDDLAEELCAQLRLRAAPLVSYLRVPSGFR